MKTFKEHFEQKLNEESYLYTKDLKPGMMVMHKEWGRGSDPMLVVKVKGKIMLRMDGEEDTFPNDGDESDYGWIVVEN